MFRFSGTDDNKVIPLSPFGETEDYNLRFNPILNAYEFKLEAYDLKLVGNYTLYVEAFLPRNTGYPSFTFNVDFEIQPCVVDLISAGPPLSEIVYTWGDSEKRFSFSQFN